MGVALWGGGYGDGDGWGWGWVWLGSVGWGGTWTVRDADFVCLFRLLCVCTVLYSGGVCMGVRRGSGREKGSVLRLRERRGVLSCLGRGHGTAAGRLDRLLNMSAAAVEASLGRVSGRGLLAGARNNTVCGSGARSVASLASETCLFRSHTLRGGRTGRRVTGRTVGLMDSRVYVFLSTDSATCALNVGLSNFARLAIVAGNVGLTLRLGSVPNIAIVLANNVMADTSTSVRKLLNTSLLGGVRASVTFISTENFSMRSKLASFDVCRTSLGRVYVGTSTGAITLMSRAGFSAASVSDCTSLSSVGVMVASSNVSPRATSVCRGTNASVIVSKVWVERCDRVGMGMWMRVWLWVWMRVWLWLCV